jgi:hypothetical protein
MDTAEDWRPIQFTDIPPRPELEQLTLQQMRAGVTNSDEMRNGITQPRRLICKKTMNNWNETPSGKFVNEHAWVLEDLVVRKVIERTAEKEYRLL